jgi:hypothetical protein
MICAKCHESTEQAEIVNEFSALKTSTVKEQNEVEAKLERLTERQRRSYHRKMENGDIEGANFILESVESEEDSDFDFSDDYLEEEDQGQLIN